MKLFQDAGIRLDKEYSVFLEYLNSNEVRLSERTGYINKKDCLAINRQFDIVSERYDSSGRTQKDYAVIDFFCFFSVRAGILRIVKAKGKGLRLERIDGYDEFWNMSSIERYIFMLAVWMGEMAVSHSYLCFGNNWIHGLMKKGKPDTAIAIFQTGIRHSFLGEYYMPEIRLLALFQLIKIEWLEEGQEDKKNKFRVKELYLTQAGFTLTKILKKHKITFLYPDDFEGVLNVIKEIAGMSGNDIKMKLMCFRDKPIEEGQCTIDFRIEVGSCVRKIRMGDQYTLDDLHYLIQKSVDFDMDHLYCFQIGMGALKREYFAPECEEELWLADEVSLAELMLYKGMHFTYLFDFGDEWIFRIYVEQILPEYMEECEIIEVKGKAPRQYRAY